MTARATCSAAAVAVLLCTSPAAGAVPAGASSPRASLPRGQLESVSCWTATLCAAVGPAPTVATSTDGGMTWTEQPGAEAEFQGQSPTFVTCGADGVGACLAEVDDAGLTAMYRTTDGGRTWGVVTPTVTGQPSAGVTAVQCLTSVDCVSQVGLDLEENPDAIGFSTDGGGTWRATYPPQAAPAGTGSESACWSFTGCMVATSASPPGSGMVSEVSYTTDGGTTWTTTSVGPFSLVDSLSCSGPLACAAVGNTPGGTVVLATTTDGGVTWTTQHRFTIPLQPPDTPLVACNAVQCVASFGSDVVQGIHGSFTDVPLAGPVVTPYGLGCAPAGDCAVVGLDASGEGDGTTLGALTGRVVCAAPAQRSGYSLVATDGGIAAFGGAVFCGSMQGRPLAAPVDAMVETPDGGGYWQVASDGGVFAFGDAAFFGSGTGGPADLPLVGAATTVDGGGYWLVDSGGGIHAFGDATFAGSMGGRHLEQPVVGMAATADGRGYWLVAADGGVFAFGDATFAGSMGGTRLQRPVVGMAATTQGGYRLVASDGGVFTFGPGATFQGSLGDTVRSVPVATMAPG